MSTVRNAVQFRCDWCGVFSAERPLAPSGVWAESPLPDGWSSIGHGSLRNDDMYKVHIKDMFGTEISHLCSDCSGRPVGELLTYVAAFPQRAKANS